MLAVVLLCFFGFSVSDDLPPLRTRPEQIHIALGEAAGSMSITWVTLNVTRDSRVEFGIGGELSLQSEASQSAFTDGGEAKRVIYIHRATLTDLKPLETYTYHVGGSDGWSSLFSFKMPRSDPDWSPRLAVYGDFGNSNAQSLARLQEEVAHGGIDGVLHVGDFAYDMASFDATVGDEFMRQIESVAAYVPYMTVVGNHEFHYNFSNYKARFTMPQAGGDGDNMFYSFDMGRAHFIAFSTEFYYYLQFGFEQIGRQFEWLKQDLKKANLNRAARPWLVVMGHRPQYCSNNDRDDCTFIRSVVRTQLEDLFYEEGVDLLFWAHEHSYERLWPIYNYTVCNGSDDNPYNNPPAPVHIITGSAGCKERHDAFVYPRPWWSALRSDDYGYTHLTIHNATHMELNQVSDDQDGVVVDHVMYVRERHGAGVFTCHQRNDAEQRRLLTHAQEMEDARKKVWASQQEPQQKEAQSVKDTVLRWERTASLKYGNLWWMQK